MGQRLVVSVIKDNKRIAAIYYHWSAYTVSALMEARDIVNYIDTYKGDDLRLGLIRYVEGKGGCIEGGSDNAEYKAIKRVYYDETFKETGSRNDGLIALTEDGMAELDSWSEGDIAIYIDTRTVYNEVFCETTVEEYNSWHDMDEQKTLNDFPLLDIGLGEMSFEDLDGVIYNLENAPYTFRQSDGTLIELIA